MLPRYMRKTRAIEALIPWLYLKGVAKGALSAPLAALLDTDAPGHAPATSSRLEKVWREEYDHWRRRDLKGKRYVYFWADALARMVEALRREGESQLKLPSMGGTPQG